MSESLTQKHKNLIKILIIGAVAFIVCFLITSKVKSRDPLVSDNGRQEIIADYKSKVPKTDKNPFELVTTGARLINSREYEMAVATLDQAVAKDKAYRDGWLYLGIAELKNGLNDQAILSLEQAKKIDPIYPDTYKYLSLAYEKTGQADLAKECYSKFEKLIK